jgi:hypothetical protein
VCRCRIIMIIAAQLKQPAYKYADESMAGDAQKKERTNEP